jgi:RNA polymerase sigma-70 factor (ECF subfamily)
MSDMRSRLDASQLVIEHHQAVYRYAYRLTGSVHDAEDLTQQVFLTAHRKIGQLRKIEKARSWLFAILRNCFFREQGRRRPALAVDLSLNTDLLPMPPPAEGIDGDRLQYALNQLPDAFRLMVVMFYFEECSYREIAERLQVPIGTVMSRLARAKGYLRSIMFGVEHGPYKRPAGVATGERG